MDRIIDQTQPKIVDAHASWRGLFFDVVRIPDLYSSEFQRVQLAEGRTRLTFAVILGIILYLAFLPPVWWIMPDIRLVDTAVRCGIGLPSALITCLVIWRARSCRVQQAAAGTLAVVYSLWLCYIVSTSSAPAAPVFITSNSIIILFVIIMMRLRLPLAATLSLTIATIQLVMSLAIGEFSWMVSLSAFLINSSLALSGLYALFELKNERRRSFLLALKDKERLEELNARNRDLDRLSETDALTGILNRRGLDRFMANHGRDPVVTALACVMIDVDNFKLYNDNYGHPAGDKVLVEIARAIEKSCEASDTVCRYGGEEFALIRPFETSPDRSSVREWADGVRRRIEELALPHAHNPPSNVITVSAGVAMLETGQSLSSVLGDADRCLYLAKTSGRNRIVCSPDYAGRSGFDLLNA